VTPDPFSSLDALIDLGFTRVMTSGQEETAVQGAALIAELIRRADGRIEVLPAGGINHLTASALLIRTGSRQVHTSARGRVADPSVIGRPGIRFSPAQLPPEGAYDRTDPALVAALRAALTG
jgi:copper homeostasis protein